MVATARRSRRGRAPLRTFEVELCHMLAWLCIRAMRCMWCLAPRASSLSEPPASRAMTVPKSPCEVPRNCSLRPTPHAACTGRGTHSPNATRRCGQRFRIIALPSSMIATVAYCASISYRHGLPPQCRRGAGLLLPASPPILLATALPVQWTPQITQKQITTKMKNRYVCHRKRRNPLAARAENARRRRARCACPTLPWRAMKSSFPRNL